MAELDGGQILVDGEHISTLSRSLIRKKMIVLTQEPLNFIGPFRLNADPHTENTYVQIMGALERLGLWRVIHGELDMNLSRLDAVMSVNFLSHGQHQQFCLARALLKKTSILLLDEPKSRLKTLLDFDKVAIIGNSQVAAFGEPVVLLSDKVSAEVKLRLHE